MQKPVEVDTGEDGWAVAASSGRPRARLLLHQMVMLRERARRVGGSKGGGAEKTWGGARKVLGESYI